MPTLAMVEQAGACSLGGGGRPRREVELAQDVRHVAVDRVLADHQAGGDLAIREPFREQTKHVLLAARNAGKR